MKNTAIVILTVMATASILYLSWIFVARLKNINTFRNREIIIEAIYAYYQSLPHESVEIVKSSLYDELESYEETFKRWWDWGYTRILPTESFERIKPFIARRGD